MTNTIYYAEIAVGFEPSGTVDVASVFDAIADGFFELTGIENHDVVADAESQTITLSMDVVGAASIEEAAAKAFAAVRTALHAAGHGTPNWEEYVRIYSQNTRSERATDLIDA